jgi:hydrogenase maturation factor
MVTILFPDGTEEDKIKGVMEQIHNTALEINAEVLGGHTEITSSVSRIVVSATAIGRALKREYITSSGARAGDDVILTKKAGLEGTAIIASDFQEFLKGKMSPEEIERAKGFINYISVIPEGRIGAKNGATAMHDVTEGGVLGAAYEIALASKVGITLREDRIPVHPETLKICQIFNLNPLGLISSGSMLITAPDGNRIISALKEAGIEGTIIGKVTEEGFRIVDKEGKERPFTPPERDELYKIL